MNLNKQMFILKKEKKKKKKDQMKIANTNSDYNAAEAIAP